MLEAAGLKVYVGGVEGLPVFPYCVLYFPNAARDSEALNGSGDRARFPFQITSVGGSDDQASWVAEKSQAALIGQTPVVPGRTCWRIEDTDYSNPIRYDPDVPNRRTYFGTDGYTIASTPGGPT